MSDAVAEQNIWYPGDDYRPREDDKYPMPISEFDDLGEIVFLVRKRVGGDLELAVNAGYLGEDQFTMRDMMLYVINVKSVMTVLHGIAKTESENSITVDWVCRELGKNSRSLIEKKKTETQ